MGEKTSEPVEAVILFDECVPRMEDCGLSCEVKEEILCKHRLKAGVFILYASLIKARRKDFYLVTHLFNLIFKNKIPISVNRDAKIFIVTTDRKFFISARRQYQTKKKVITLLFNQKTTSISFGIYTVTICIIRCPNASRNRLNLLHCIIGDLNKRLT